MSTERPDWIANIRVVGFDLDQTLYPKSPLIDEKIQGYLYEKIAEHKNVSLENARTLFNERYRGGAGLSGRQTLLDLGLPNAAELVQEALEKADIASVLSPDPELNQLLAGLHSAYQGVDLITGSSKRQTDLKLAAITLAPHTFTHIITADDSSKSSGESYQRWFALYPDYAPEQFLYVGDRIRIDHEIPAALGIHTALVYVKETNPSLTCLQYPSPIELLAALQ